MEQVQDRVVWLTYAWDDNVAGDVDFVAQELVRAGLVVRLDRWNLPAGRRLWEQIESFIQDPSKSDGWLFYATQASLGSEACREEYAYALDRALRSRGGVFPLIAVFPGTVDECLIPAGIKTRLFVNLTDPEWKERVVAAVEGREPCIAGRQVEPYDLRIHKLGVDYGEGRWHYAIELRPRAGAWAPFFAAVPLDEKDDVSPKLSHGAARRIPGSVILFDCGSGRSRDGKWWMVFAANEATPTQSYYVCCKKLPSRLVFGVQGGSPHYEVRL